jgi:hypothetical protein
MKYIKRYNEELDPSTYRSAANILKRQSNNSNNLIDKLTKHSEKRHIESGAV